MASEAAGATIGAAVAIAVVVVLAIVLVVTGLVTSQQRTHEIQVELNRRREALREQHRREQMQWRQRRLRDVVLLLVERGDAAEGIPLAVQLPHKNEVSCRREIKRPRRNPAAEQMEDELREEEESALPPEVRAILYKPLPELLAHGRPPEAEAGPDILQMLLDGQEPANLSYVNCNEDDEENEYGNELHDEDNWVFETVEPLASNNTLLLSSPTSVHSPGMLSLQSNADHETVAEGHNKNSNIINNNNNNNNSSNAYSSPTLPVTSLPAPLLSLSSCTNTITTPTTTTQTQNSNTNAGNNGVVNDNINSDGTNTLTSPTQTRLAQKREERKAAILREIQAVREGKVRRRKTAEEVYGVSSQYLPNLNNIPLIHVDRPVAVEEQQSSIFGFLAPMSPFRSRRRSHKSSFASQSPTISRAMSQTMHLYNESSFRNCLSQTAPISIYAGTREVAPF